MSEIDRYLSGLRNEMRVTGATRRRILAECAEHLLESAAAHGETEAVARFGPAAELAARFNADFASHRGRRATLAVAGALLAAAAATVDLARATPVHASAPKVLALVFVVASQVAGVALGSAILQALHWRHMTAPAGTLLLLARRNTVAVVAAALTITAGALTVTGSHAGVALGGALTVLAAAAWAAQRAGRLARELPEIEPAALTSPLDDLAALCVRVPPLHAGLEALRGALDPLRHPVRCCALVALLAGAGAFVRDHGEGATPAQAAVTAATEAAAVVSCFAVLGRPLGLRAT